MKFISLTAVPEPPSAAADCAVRDVAPAVAGRLALFERLGAVVVDALVAVDGLVARKKEKIKYLLNRRINLFLLVARLCDVGRSFVTVVLLPDVVVRDAAVEDVECEEPPVAPLDAVFVGGLSDG